jgi:hypothetical protein
MSSIFFRSVKIAPVRERREEVIVDSVSMRIVRTNELDTFGGRLAWLLRTRGKRQSDLVRLLGRSSGFVSEVARPNNQKEFDWPDTAKVVQYLGTNGDFFLGLREDDAPIVEREEAPYYKYEESDEIAKVCDEAPEWLRKQMLATAKIQLQTAKEAALQADEWADRLRNAVQVSGLVLGEERSSAFIREIEDIIGDLARRRATMEAVRD